LKHNVSQKEFTIKRLKDQLEAAEKEIVMLKDNKVGNICIYMAVHM